MEIRTTISSI